MFLVLAQSIAVIGLQASDSLTIDQALDRAKRLRPAVAAAAAGIERARGASALTTSIPNPLLQIERDNLAPTYKATVAQPLAWLVRRSADQRAGRALVDRAVADSSQGVADVAREVRVAFFATLAANEQLRLAGEQARLADSLVGFAGRRVAAGDISELERDQIAQEASRARLAARQAREDASVAVLAFSRAIAWTGRGSPTPFGSLSDGLPESIVPFDNREVDLTADVPAIRAARADSIGAAARLSAARIARIPIPSLIAGREWGASAAGQTNAIFGLALPLPFWNQGGPGVREARGAALEGAARLSEARLDVAHRTEAARLRVAESTSRARFARDSLLPEASRIRAGAVRLYEAGRTGILPVFDAIRVEREVSREVLLELLAFQRARAELLALLGRTE